MANKTLSHQVIIEHLKSDYNLDVVALTWLPLGADMNASVFRAKTHDQASYFIKVKRGHHHDGAIEIVAWLKDAGIREIIPPIKTVSGELTQKIEDFTLIVYPFVHGVDGFNRHLTDAQWIKLGAALRNVHDLDVPLSIEHKIRKEVYSPQWREAMRSLYPLLDAQPVGDELSHKIWQFMAENIFTIQRLVDRAEELAQMVQQHSHKHVLCHSDIHAGNVLLVGDETIYIVDWDAPIMAPKERDLMFIGGGVANVWNKPREEELFYQGYGATVVNSTILAYYRHERIIEDIAEYANALLLTTSCQVNERQDMYKHFLAMFEKNGVVDLAFGTID